MKSTRKYILAVCALAIGFALPVVRAEDAPAKPKHEGGKEGKGGEHGGGDRAAMLKEKLNLTDAQVTDIKKIFADEQAELKALKDKAGDPKEKRGEMMKIREGTKSKIEAVLTPEQRTKFDEIRPKGPKDGKKEGKKDKKDAE